MNLPNRELALVEHEKVRNYLLNDIHPDGFGKAAFFKALGFQREAWATLADAFRQIGRDFPVTKSMTSAHGRKYIVDGVLQTPVGQTVMVRTIWIVDKGETRPRLITAYPKEVES